MIKTCSWCRHSFTCRKPKRQFCSRKCSADSRSRDFYKGIGRKGGTVKAERLRPQIIAKCKELAKGLEPWAAFKAGALWQERRSNYTTYSRGVRMGYAKGWEACAKAMRVA